jgi:thymidine phosphorylase
LFHGSCAYADIRRKAANLDAARKLAEETIRDGKAWEKFAQLVKAQKGELSFIENPDQLPSGSIEDVVVAEQDGYLSMLNAQMIGEAAVILGAGREKKGAAIDLGVGFHLEHKVGEQVAREMCSSRSLPMSEINYPLPKQN